MQLYFLLCLLYMCVGNISGLCAFVCVANDVPHLFIDRHEDESVRKQTDVEAKPFASQLPEKAENKQ